MQLLTIIRSDRATFALPRCLFILPSYLTSVLRFPLFICFSSPPSSPLLNSRSVSAGDIEGITAPLSHRFPRGGLAAFSMTHLKKRVMRWRTVADLSQKLSCGDFTETAAPFPVRFSPFILSRRHWRSFKSTEPGSRMPPSPEMSALPLDKVDVRLLSSTVKL